MWNLEQRIITESEPSSQSATNFGGESLTETKGFSGKLEECVPNDTHTLQEFKTHKIFDGICSL